MTKDRAIVIKEYIEPKKNKDKDRSDYSNKRPYEADPHAGKKDT